MRFYTDLAPWWPLISAVDHYAEEAAETVQLLQRYADSPKRVLELGCGGGHNAVFLKEHFELTLTDLSVDMLAQSKKLNPECRHLEGDMRTLRLGETFDAVFVHDAIDYMTTPADLQAAVNTAAAHCGPGGVVLLMPDCTTDTFEPGADMGGDDGEGGCGIRYLEWCWDPDPTDTWVQNEYSFVLHHADGRTESVFEVHKTGLFPPQLWLSCLETAGLVAEMVLEVTSEARTARQLFIGRAS